MHLRPRTSAAAPAGCDAVTELVLLVDDLGGGTYGNQANRLATGLAVDPGCHVTVLGYGGERAADLPEGVTTERLHAGRALAAGPALVRYLVDRRPDVLVTHQVHMNLVAVVAARVARRRGWRGRLAIGHDHPIALSHRENRRDNRYAARVLYPRADLVLVPSPTVADDAVAHCGVRRDRVLLVPNAIDRHVPGPAPHPWLADGSPVFLTAGRLVAYKRFDLVVDALAALPDGVRLLVVGGGPAHDALAAHIRRRGLAARARLVGFVDDPRRFMEHSTGFVLASQEEGFSQVLAEAMSTGCPVVTTDAQGGGPRLVTDHGRAGILVPMGDVDALAAGMRQLLDPVARDAWSRRARERVEAFSPEACARLVLDGLAAR